MSVKHICSGRFTNSVTVKHICTGRFTNSITLKHINFVPVDLPVYYCETFVHVDFTIYLL